MTCKVLVTSPDGSSAEARAVLDSGLISLTCIQSLSTITQTIDVLIMVLAWLVLAGISHASSKQSFASLSVAPIQSPFQIINISAIVVPRVTCSPISSVWSQVESSIWYSVDFGCPGRVEVLLGVDVFVHWCIGAAWFPIRNWNQLWLGSGW
jgi:hypothetical protein